MSEKEKEPKQEPESQAEGPAETSGPAEGPATAPNATVDAPSAEAADAAQPTEPAQGEATTEEATEAAHFTDPGQLGIDEEKIEMLKDVVFQVSVELGQREISFEEVLSLGKGSVIELNKLAEDPVDVYVNRRKIAEGEVVVVDEHFGVRITKLFSAVR